MKRTFKDLLNFWLRKKKYAGKKIWFSGKMRKVNYETLDFVFLEGIKGAIPKQLLKNYGIFSK